MTSSSHRAAKSKDSKPHDETASPYNYIYQPRDSEEARLVSALMQAGERVADFWREPREVPSEVPKVTFASHDAKPLLLTSEDTDSLMQMLAEMRHWIAAEPRRTQLLDGLRDALGSGELLRVIFRNLFPQQASQPVLDREGKRILSKREVEILREAAGDCPRDEIAQRLHISPKTVDNHLGNIYEKLGVNRPMQAVARAIALNYLDMDVFDLIAHTSRSRVGNMTLSGTYLGEAGVHVPKLPEAREVQHLAMFGLLLFTLSASGGHQVFRDHKVQQRKRNIEIVQMNHQGARVHTFEVNFLIHPQSIVVAPPQAALEGFTPGNLFITHQLPTQRSLNACAIAEFTPQGEYLRSFCGGGDIETRGIGGYVLMFGPDSRLFFASSWLTDAILAFGAGGKSITRFAEGCCLQIAAHQDSIYAVQGSGVGSSLRLWDLEGTPQSTIVSTDESFAYIGLAISTKGNIYLCHKSDIGSVIEEYAMDGTPLRTQGADTGEPLRIPGFDGGRFTIDSQDRLIVPCRRTNDIKIVATNGNMQRSLPLNGKHLISDIALDAEDNLWFCLASD